LALGQGLAVDQEAGSRCAAAAARVHVLRDEPLRELPGGDAGPRRGRILVVRRWGEELEARETQQALELLDQPRLVNLLADAGPVVQPADKDGLGRQVEERAGAERRYDLAVADLAVGPGIGSGHGGSPGCGSRVPAASLFFVLHVDVVERLDPEV